MEKPKKSVAPKGYAFLKTRSNDLKSTLVVAFADEASCAPNEHHGYAAAQRGVIAVIVLSVVQILDCRASLAMRQCMIISLQPSVP